MLEWLKTILGDIYTEDIDKSVSAQIGKDFVARADFNTANEAKKTLAAQVAERDKQLEGLKTAAGDVEGLKKQIGELQTTNKAAQEKFDSDVKTLRLGTLLDARLTKEGAVNLKAVKALLDTGKISVDGENLVGLDEQLTPLKTAEAWAFPGAAGAAGAEGQQSQQAAAGQQTSVRTGMQQGGSSQQLSGVEAEFYKRNPDLKPE